MPRRLKGEHLQKPFGADAHPAAKEFLKMVLTQMDVASDRREIRLLLTLGLKKAIAAAMRS